MIGRRTEVSPHLYEPGDYGRWGANWYALAPGTGDFLANLGDGEKHHKVTEHEDGTITASPSILVGDGKGNSWHGYLERGVWRAC